MYPVFLIAFLLVLTANCKTGFEYTTRQVGECNNASIPCGPPDIWYTLETAWSTCREDRQGATQSPINIVDNFVRCSTPAIKLATLSPDSTDFEDLGQTEEVILGIPHALALVEGNQQVGSDFTLAQLHFHSPSEHTINGLYYVLEMHLVHQRVNEDGSTGYLVLAVLFHLSDEDNVWLSSWNFTDKAQMIDSDLEKIDVDIQPYQGLPHDLSSLAYVGSLTTPPCTEGVQWRVFIHSRPISQQQLSAFNSVFKGNNRPTQPLNGRTVQDCKQPTSYRGHF